MRIRLLSVIYSGVVKLLFSRVETVHIVLPYLKIVTGTVDAPCLDIVREEKSMVRFRSFYIPTMLSRVTYIVMKKLSVEERRLLIKEINTVLENNHKKSNLLSNYGIERLESRYLYWIVTPQGKNMSILVGLERDIVRRVVDETMSFISTCIDYIRRDQFLKNIIEQIEELSARQDMLNQRLCTIEQALIKIAEILETLTERIGTCENHLRKLVRKNS